MAKRNINLLIVKEEEATLDKKIKIILPAIAISLLGVFLFLYIISLTITKNYINQFNLLSNEENLLNAKIKNAKNTEGLYTSSVKLVNSIDGLFQTNKNLIVSYIPRMYSLKADNLDISDVSIDKDGAVSFSVQALNINTLEQFIINIRHNTDKLPFKNIKAHAIVRDKQGRYSFKITLNIIS